MTQAVNDERLSLDYVSVEDLNAALRVFRAAVGSCWAS